MSHIELRWAVLPGTNTEAPRLQFRTCETRPHWSEWTDVPTEIVPRKPEKTKAVADEWQAGGCKGCGQCNCENAAAEQVVALTEAASEPDSAVGSRKCSRPGCHGDMLPGVAMVETYGGTPDFVGGDVVTMSGGGPGRVITCLKCNACGHSVTSN